MNKKLSKLLTKEEAEELRKLKDECGNDELLYEKLSEEYLTSIHFDDRLADYLKDKWYIKLLKWIIGKEKRNKVKE